jgi:hypothetical protein
MLEFPLSIKPENKEKFKQFLFNRNIAYMRRDIYEFILQCDEEKYFDIENFRHKYLISSSDMGNMRNQVMKELGSLGWNVKTSFSGTGLFIFSPETDTPKLCYEDEFDSYSVNL